jgi:hypothetical protein
MQLQTDLWDCRRGWQDYNLAQAMSAIAYWHQHHQIADYWDYTWAMSGYTPVMLGYSSAKSLLGHPSELAK